MTKRALITGISGQDGSYLAELLVAMDYEVFGIVRRTSQPNLSNLSAVADKVTLFTGDMQDATSVYRIIEDVEPDEIYNLAAMSQVKDSYDHPDVTQDINAGGLLRILEAVRLLQVIPTKIYQACSSEMFGRVVESPQNENTPFYPRSPYGSSKVTAYNHARLYREAYRLKVYCGILYNHESERRGEAFLSRKVCKAAAEIASGRRTERLKLGNLDARRDWGYAKEYVEWIWRIVQHSTPDDFIIATGENHSVREWVELAFRCAGISDWEHYVDYDRSLTRPAEVDHLLGDASKSRRVLGFEPQVKFAGLVKIMVDAEMAKLNPGLTVHSDERRELECYPEAKVITAKQDTVIGKHYHKLKTEKFILSEGSGSLFRRSIIDGRFQWGHSVQEMEVGRIYQIEPYTYHEFHLNAGSILVGLNTRTYDASDDYHVKYQIDTGYGVEVVSAR